MFGIRVFRGRVGLAGLLALLLMLPGMTRAQEPPPFIALYSAGTDRGDFSMFLPIGWTFIDAIPDTLAIAFGETEAAAQSRLDNIDIPLANDSYIGAGGSIKFYTLEELELTPEATTEDLIPLQEDFMRLALQIERGGILRHPETVTIRSGSGIYSLIGNEYETTLTMHIRFGDYVAFIRAGAPSREFDTYSSQLIAILESIRVPGETILAVPELAQSMMAVTGDFSLRIPAGWTFSRIVGDAMSDALVFGSSSNVYDGLADTIQNNASRNLTDAGIGGYLGTFSAELLAESDTDAQAVYDRLANSLADLPHAESQPWSITGLDSEGILFHAYQPVAGRNDGAHLGIITGLMVLENGDLFSLTLMVNPSHDFRRSRALMDAIVASLQFPAEEGGQFANFGKLARVTPELFDLAAQTPDETGTVPYVSSGQLISLRLPAGWFVRDILDTDVNSLGLGPTETEARDQQELGISDSLGGTLFMLPYTNSFMPAYPNDTQLINTLTKWLEDKQAEVIKAPLVITTGSGKRLVYAVYHINHEGLLREEWGYVSIHDFGATFVFVKLNAASQALFDANDDLLGAINDSIQMPAVLPE